jgi:outer membrane protein, adhesin transport system
VLDSYRAQFGIGRRSLLDLLDAQGSVYSATVDTEIARFGTLLAEYGMLAQVNRLRGHFGIGQTAVDPRMYGPR